MKRIRNVLATALLATLLASCATPMQRDVRTTVQDAEAQAMTQMAAMREQDEGYYEEVDAYYVGTEVIDATLEDRQELAVLDRPVTYQRTDLQTIGQFAEFISRAYGVSVTVSQDAIDHAQKLQSTPQATSNPDGSVATSTAQPGAFRLRYSGSLRGMLDAIAAMTGNAWRLRKNGIEIFHLDTRVYAINALSKEKKTTQTITNTAGAKAQSGGEQTSGGAEVTSGQTTEVTTEHAAYAAIETTIKAMLSGEGKVAATGTTGTVTVTDVPMVLDRIGDYVRQLNERLVRQVAVDVVLYSVDTVTSENYAINWDLVYNYMNDNTALNLVSVGQAPIDSSSLGATIVDANSRFDGTKLIFDALSTQGETAIVTRQPMLTLSGQQVPFLATASDSYLAEVSVSQVANVGTQLTLTPRSIVTGIALNVTPMLLDDQSILVEAQIQLSTLKGFRKVGSNDPEQPSIEVPSIDSRDIMQTVRLRSGQTALLTGFEQDRVSGDRRGVGSPDFMVAGGGRNTEKKRTVLVLAITAKAVR
jgi:type IVB pilus formation R64 PilN family outer membrane protein